MLKYIIFFVFFSPIALESSHQSTPLEKPNAIADAKENSNLTLFTPALLISISSANNERSSKEFQTPNSQRSAIKFYDDNSPQKNVLSTLGLASSCITRIKRRQSHNDSSFNSRRKTLIDEHHLSQNSGHFLSVQLSDVQESDTDNDGEDHAENSKLYLEEARAQMRRSSGNSEAGGKTTEPRRTNSSEVRNLSKYEFPNTQEVTTQNESSKQDDSK